jgi:hypothetical protein
MSWPTSFRKSEMRWLAAVAALMVVAASMRLPGLGTKPLSTDEAYSWRISQYSCGDLLYRTRWDANPPFYYLVLKAWEEVWGTSPWALRGLSVFLAVLTVPLSFAACMEAVKLGLPESSPVSSSARGGALFAAFLVAVHPTQIIPGQVARMYPLGVFLAALTSWLLFKALGQERRPGLWWSAYGMATAAFAYTHYYALFTLVAQGIFAAVFLLARVRKTPGQVAVQAGWFGYAVLLGGILYAPWLPILSGQTGDVREGFWISELHSGEVARVFWPWCTGLSLPDSWERTAWLIVLVFCLGWIIYSRSPGGCFFLVQAALPWFLSIGLSILWQRSIFYDRYLVFSHWALAAFWGVAWSQLPGWPFRIFLTIFVGMSAVWEWNWKTAPGKPAIAQAAEFLESHYRPADQVWTTRPAELNRFRYYAGQIGVTDIAVKCWYSPGQKGHVVHLASLSGEDILTSDAWEKPPPRFWLAMEGAVSHGPPNSKKILEATFEDGVQRYSLTLFERGVPPSEKH